MSESFATDLGQDLSSNVSQRRLKTVFALATLCALATGAFVLLIHFSTKPMETARLRSEQEAREISGAGPVLITPTRQGEPQQTRASAATEPAASQGKGPNVYYAPTSPKASTAPVGGVAVPRSAEPPPPPKSSAPQLTPQAEDTGVETGSATASVTEQVTPMSESMPVPTISTTSQLPQTEAAELAPSAAPPRPELSPPLTQPLPPSEPLGNDEEPSPLTQLPSDVPQVARQGQELSRNQQELLKQCSPAPQ